MPIEQITITGYRFQCDRCPDTATPPARNVATLRALYPGWQLPDADGHGATLCPACAGNEPQRARRVPGKSLREALALPLGAALLWPAFWATAQSVSVGDALTAADWLTMRYDPTGQPRQTYAAIGAALGISANRARAMVLRATHRMRAELRWIEERAAAFNAHCGDLHNADFEVCSNARCRAVVAEEKRRGLL